MTITSFRTSAAPQTTNLVDATAANEVIHLEMPAIVGPNVGNTTVKVDASAHTVIVKDSAGTTLATLSTQWDSVVLFCDGTTWTIAQAPTSTVLAGVQVADLPPTTTAFANPDEKAVIDAMVATMQSAGLYS